MTIYVKTGGAWSPVTEVWRKTGGAWAKADVYRKSGGAWAIAHSNAPPPAVSALAPGEYNSSDTGSVYAGIAFQSDGYEWQMDATGALTSNLGLWLDSGSASSVWVEAFVTLGSWNSLDPGPGRHNLGSTQTWRIIKGGAQAGTTDVTGYFKFYDAAAGGNTLQTTASATWTAEKTSACPTCCFTPDTLILLATGLQVPITSVKIGDMIAVWNPATEKVESEAVTGVLIRTARPMYRIGFANGSHLNASEDHPLHVHGKGPRSINNGGLEYKGFGLPEPLQIGDYVTMNTGELRKVVSIEALAYKGFVYSFENSLFYANGVLVY